MHFERLGTTHASRQFDLTDGADHAPFQEGACPTPILEAAVEKAPKDEREDHKKD
ncbi:MAG: hypothetical protein Tsb0026_00090 [Sulfuricaulis sp.]